MLANTDVDSAVASARSEMQAALDEILAAERAEAAALRKEQEGRNVLVNYLHTHFAFGKGFFLGAWGLIKSLKEMGDLVSPYNHAWNMLASAWKAKVSPKEGWYASFLRNYSEAQHEELVEALGFDPASVTREQIAEAYEAACFIYDDGPSKAILARFAVDYAKTQNIEEVAEFGGGAVFELVLAALLIAFTGGAGLAARGAASVRHAASLKRLGTALQRLSRALKNAKIKLKGRAQGSGTGAQMVEVPRPNKIESLSDEEVSLWHATASPGAAQGVLNGIDPKYLNPDSRFGAAFYVAEQPGTTLAELAHHGVDASHGVRFVLDKGSMKVLDLTDPATAKAWRYEGGPISSTTQEIGVKAQGQGYNVIRFYSERANGGINNAILDNFNEILQPVFVTPVKP